VVAGPATPDVRLDCVFAHGGSGRVLLENEVGICKSPDASVSEGTSLVVRVRMWPTPWSLHQPSERRGGAVELRGSTDAQDGHDQRLERGAELQAREAG